MSQTKAKLVPKVLRVCTAIRVTLCQIVCQPSSTRRLALDVGAPPVDPVLVKAILNDVLRRGFSERTMVVELVGDRDNQTISQNGDWLASFHYCKTCRDLLAVDCEIEGRAASWLD